MAMGQSVGRGMGWMAFSTVAIKALAFVAQIVLGWLLSKGDFGLYSTALAVAGIVTAFRDGGVRDLLVQRGAASYERLVGPVYWMAFTINSAAALALCLAAPAIAAFYDMPLTPMLVVIGLSLPLGTPAAILQCKLRMQLRFGVLSRIQIGSALVRNVGTIVLAAPPFSLGPLAFVLPLILIAIYEGVASYLAARERPWKRRAEPRQWGGLFLATRWLIFATLANIMFDFGPFAVLGAMVSEQVVGVYFFAWQITAQIGVLLSSNVQQVLFPALARMEGNRVRMAHGSLRALRALMLVGGYMSLCLAAVMGPLESVLWHGRWAEAVPGVQILGFFFPMRITFGLCAAVMLAEGRFKGLSFLTLYEGIGITIAAAIAGWTDGSATAVAWWTGGAMALGRLIGTMYVMGSMGVGPGRVLRAILPPWVLATGAAALAVGVDDFLNLGVAARSALAGAGLGPAMETIVADGLRVAVIGAVCTAAFAVGARVIIPTRLREAIAVGPKRIGAKVERLLLLKQGD
ncbi:MAG: oligosaccharide flippase family protein [Phycisphaerales bacterium]|nr:oligosaccharide flippase family protein [Phycisphaerales bacterium]